MSEPRNSATATKAKSDKERPQREPKPDTLEGPGHEEAKDKSDASNETTRRGEH